MKHYKFGYAAVIGRPNTGKSTLLNRLIGQKIAIEADKPQATRRRINGILTTDEAQIVFVDTPGIHKPLDGLGECLVKEAQSAVNDVDIVLFTADGSSSAGRGDKWIASNVLKDYKGDVIIVLNKTDLVKDIEKREENLLSYKMLFDKNYPVVKISAKTGRNLDTLVKNIIRKLPEGEKVYADDEITDETMRNIACSLIREKILLNTRDEIPHSTAVIIESYEETEKLDKISAEIIVEQETQKRILIGAKGSMLKKIGTEARREIENLAGRKVYLELQVKVIKDWRKKSKDLDKLY